MCYRCGQPGYIQQDHSLSKVATSLIMFWLPLPSLLQLMAPLLGQEMAEIAFMNFLLIRNTRNHPMFSLIRYIFSRMMFMSCWILVQPYFCDFVCGCTL